MAASPWARPGAHLGAGSQGRAEKRACSRASAAALAAERADAFAESAGERDPSWALATVWTTPGGLHSRLRAGCLAPGRLPNLVARDAKHPALWPFAAAKATLCLNSSLAAAASALLVAGKWVGQPPPPSASRGRGNTRGGWQAALLGSARYTDHQSKATERLKCLLRRTLESSATN
jgi:hypothetical protein